MQSDGGTQIMRELVVTRIFYIIAGMKHCARPTRLLHYTDPWI